MSKNKKEIITSMTVASLGTILLLAAVEYIQTNEIAVKAQTLVPLSTPLASNSSEVIELDYEEFLNSIRVPRGFADVNAVNKFALENNIIQDTNYMNDSISIGELAQILKSVKLYYSKMPTGFGDKIKEEDIDYTSIPTTSAYSEELLFCLENGYLTSEQVKNFTATMTLNEFTRILYNVGINGLLYSPTEDEINAMLDTIKEVTKDDKECRIAKFTFLNQYDLVPFTYNGDVPLERLVTKQDVVNMLITFVDTLDIYGTNTENPNAGCAPCADAALVLEREKYNEKQ